MKYLNLSVYTRLLIQIYYVHFLFFLSKFGDVTHSWICLEMKAINSEKVMGRKMDSESSTRIVLLSIDNLMISTEDEQAEEFTNLLYRHRSGSTTVKRRTLHT